MRYVLTTTLVIPAGTELAVDNQLGDGGLSCFADDDLRAQLFISRAAALRLGIVEARPELRIVADNDG